MKPNGDFTLGEYLPDYLTDLNAMHVAEGTLDANQWDAYRKWADEQLFLGVVYDLRKGFIWDSLAITIARGVYWTVRSKLGELAAMGRL